MIIQGETIKALIDTGANFSVLNTTKIKGFLPQSKTSVQMVGFSNTPFKALKSLPLEFYLGELKGRHSFFLVESAPVYLIGRDLLEAYEAHISFTPKGEMFLDLKDESDFLHHITFVTHDEDATEQDKLLGSVPKE